MENNVNQNENMVLKKSKNNVLLLTMSTLPGHGTKDVIELRKTDYTYELRTPLQGKKGSISFGGYSQLEPIPLSLAWRLAVRGEQLDKIIVINNSSTKEVETKITLIGMEDPDQNEYLGISAFEFFEKRIETYDYKNILYDNERFNIDVKKPDIISVEINDSNEMSGIYEICDILRNCKKECEKLNLYLDIHGGLRSQQIVVDSVISILEHEDIHIYEAYSTNGNPPQIKIENADNSIDIFKLVSGVNEFINYGRSESLYKYTLPKDMSMTETSDDTELIDAINQICNSIQLCRMDEFSERINNLSDALENYNKGNNGKLTPVIDLIKLNYKDLFDNKNDLVAQIEWCVNHEFYQQALTIIESLIPEYLFEKGVVWYEAKKSRSAVISIKNSLPSNNTTILCTLDKAESVTRQLSFTEFINKCKREWIEIENYIFEECTECVNVHTPQGRRIAFLGLKTSKIDYLNIPTRFDSNLVDNDEYKKTFFASKIDRENNYKWVSDIWLRVSDVNSDVFNRFAQIHFMLKNQRNLTNHARTVNNGNNGDRADVSQIKVAIEAYVELLNSLIEHTNAESVL